MPARHPLRGEREAERHGREKPFRDERDHDADREHEPIRDGHSDEARQHEEEGSDADREHGHESSDADELALQRALSSMSALCEICDAPETGAHTGCGDDRLSGAGGHVRAREDRVGGLGRVGLAGQRRLVDAQVVSRDELRIGSHLVAGREQEHVAGHDLLAVDRDRNAVPADANLERQHESKGFDRPFRSVLLHEREDGVHHDDHHDRHGELGKPADQRERRARPEEQREQVHEVCDDLTQVRGPLGLRERVRPDFCEPLLGLGRRQPVHGRRRPRRRGSAVIGRQSPAAS